MLITVWQTFTVGHIHGRVPVGPETSVKQDSIADRASVRHQELSITFFFFSFLSAFVKIRENERKSEYP